MASFFSENLLLALVYGLRVACKRHIKYEEFTTISGFLCIDIDGEIQHRFVISELINRASRREGHSSCLKTLNWNVLRDKCSSCRYYKNEKTLSNKHTVTSSTKVPHPTSEKDYSKSQPAAHWSQGSEKIKHKPMQKSLSGSFNHYNFSTGRSKLSNQTFTLANVRPITPQKRSESSPSRNFSSATISISKEERKCDLQTSIEPDALINTTEQGIIKSFHKPERGSAIPTLNRGEISASINNGKSLSSRAWYASDKDPMEDKSPKLTVISKHGLLDQITQHKGHHDIKHSKRSDIKVTKLRRIRCDNSDIDRSASYTVRSYVPEIKPVRRSQTSAITSKKSPVQILHLTQSSSSEDSDVSIGSTRPKYLVQHNGELLLPCPNLNVHQSDHAATAMNNNRIHSAALSRHSSEESNVIVPSTSHISSLINSIMGALTGSSSKNPEDSSNNTTAMSMEIENARHVRDIGKYQISPASNGTLHTISSLEPDLPSPRQDQFSEDMDSVKIETLKLTSGRKCMKSQQLHGSPAHSRRRPRVFKWMRLFKQESSRLSARDYSSKRNGSLTSLRSWSSLKSIIGFTSRGTCTREKKKSRKHHK